MTTHSIILEWSLSGHSPQSRKKSNTIEVT